MNEEKTPLYNEDGIENLTNAIVLQAVKDYRKALKGSSLNGKFSAAVIADCERFFRSDWYRQLYRRRQISTNSKKRRYTKKTRWY